jgi:hypothetical protein
MDYGKKVPFRQVEKVLSLERKNKKRAFCFVLSSLIRTFVPAKTNNNRKETV